MIILSGPSKSDGLHSSPRNGPPRKKDIEIVQVVLCRRADKAAGPVVIMMMREE